MPIYPDVRPYKPEQASVFDSPMTQAINTFLRWTGLGNPQDQVLALMNPMDVGESGGLVGALRNVIKAYHGSPHDFDRFSMEHIGKGEGAQAYGHGLYFAEAPEVAKTYQGKVSAMQGGKPFIDGRPINWDDPAETAAFELWRHNGDRQAAAEFYARTFKKDSPVVSLLQSDTPLPSVTPPGRMYEVAIHASPDQLLDWDKPLSQQSEHVRRVLEAQGISDPNMLGRDAYNALSKSEGMQGSSLRLSGDGLPLGMSGIPGLKYLDGGSRAAGEGTRNYVIWDESLIEVLRKLGVAVPVIEALRREAQANNGRIQRQRIEQVMQ